MGDLFVGGSSPPSSTTIKLLNLEEQIMKTIQDFYDKYGTGKNYEDLFAIMCKAKRENNHNLAIDVDDFISDLKAVIDADFNELLWRDYKFITDPAWTNAPVDDDEEEDTGEPEYVLSTPGGSQVYTTYAKALEGYNIHYAHYKAEGWPIVLEHKSRRAITIDGEEVRALRVLFRKRKVNKEITLYVRIDID